MSEEESLWKKITRSDKGASIVETSPIWRMLAFFIDFIIFKLITIGIFFVLLHFDIITTDIFRQIIFSRSNVYEQPEYFQGMIDIYIHLMVTSIFLSYFTIFETKYVWGATPGKKVFKIQVVDSHGNRIGLFKSFLRNSTKWILRIPFLGFAFGWIELGLIFFFFKRSGDFLTNCEVASSVSKGRFPFNVKS
ncbi:MAG: RDD family protein [Thermoplasmatota archaeon]